MIAHGHAPQPLPALSLALENSQVIDFVRFTIAIVSTSLRYFAIVLSAELMK